MEGDESALECHGDQSDLGCGFVDLCPIWNQKGGSSYVSKTRIQLYDSAEEFDQHGQAVESSVAKEEVCVISVVEF